MDNRDLSNLPRAPWRDAWNEIVFGRETFAGRLFDSILLILILLSVLAVLLESVPSIREKYGMFLRVSIWIFTGLFTAEYVTRLVTATSAKRYARSFFGIVDFLAIGPVYLGFLLGAARSFSVLRSLRLLRVFQILTRLVVRPTSLCYHLSNFLPGSTEDYLLPTHPEVDHSLLW